MSAAKRPRVATRKRFAKIAETAFSTAFEEMWNISVRDDPNGRVETFVSDYLQAMREYLEEYERTWAEQGGLPRFMLRYAAEGREEAQS